MEEKNYSMLDNSALLKFRQKMDCDNVSDLIPILNEHRCVIAGSYVLQTLCDASWANDIDIWTYNVDMHKLTSDLEKIKYVKYDVNDTDLEEQVRNRHLAVLKEKLNDPHNLLTQEDKSILLKIKEFYERKEPLFNKSYPKDVFDEYRRMRDSIIRIHFFKHTSKPPIQVIETKNGIIPCIDDFDINICRVYYDGQNLFAKNKEYVLECIRHKFAEITREASQSNTMREWLRTLKRALKYTKRGFFIDFRKGYRQIERIFNDTDAIQKWNYILCAYRNPEYELRLENIFKNDYPTSYYLKTLKLPYFHSFVVKEKLIVFGYLINPNNKLGKLAKGIAKNIIFVVKKVTPGYKNKCINRVENMQNAYMLEQKVDRDSLTVIESMLKPVPYNIKIFISEDAQSIQYIFKLLLRCLESNNTINIQKLGDKINRFRPNNELSERVLIVLQTTFRYLRQYENTNIPIEIKTRIIDSIIENIKNIKRIVKSDDHLYELFEILEYRFEGIINSEINFTNFLDDIETLNNRDENYVNDIANLLLILIKGKTISHLPPETTADFIEHLYPLIQNILNDKEIRLFSYILQNVIDRVKNLSTPKQLINYINKCLKKYVIEDINFSIPQSVLRKNRISINKHVNKEQNYQGNSDSDSENEDDYKPKKKKSESDDDEKTNSDNEDDYKPKKYSSDEDESEDEYKPKKKEKEDEKYNSDEDESD